MTIISACNHSGRHGDEAALFAGMDSLLEAAPESALTVLTRLQPKVDSISDRSLSMRQRMHLASARNKLYLQMPSDSAFREVVDYYDRHGSANDCMKAHYLLGCIYRDMKEAPQAIRCYQDAIGCADTLSVDCDYATLLRVYSQMGDIFYYQYLPECALECYQQQSHYALKAKDTYNYIRGIELQIQPYYLLKDSTSMLAITDSAYHLYMSHNMPEHAARVFPCAIYIHLNRKEYAEARELMDQFELKSGLFDDEGNIVGRGYERYDYARGLYSLGQGKPDKAMEYFQRLQKHGLEQEAYDGFARIYRLRANPDSTYKYLELSDKKLDAQLRNMQIQALTLSESMYSYERLQREAETSRLKSERNTYMFWLYSTLMISLLTVLISRYIKRRREIKILNQKFREQSNQYIRLRAERDVLQASYEQLKETSASEHEEKTLELLNLIHVKEKDIETLKGELLRIRYKGVNRVISQNLKAFMASGSVMELLSMIDPTPPVIDIKNPLWNRVFADAKDCIPVFYAELNSHDLSKQKKVIACLTILNISNSSIANVFNTSVQNISKLEANINKALFGESTSTTLRKNLKKLCVEDDAEKGA